MAFVEDFSIFLDETEFAVPVVALGINGLGIFDMPGEYVGPDGIFVSDESQVRLLRSVYGALDHGDPVVVNGQGFTVRDWRPVFDGAFMQVFLRRSTLPPPVSGPKLLLEDGGALLLEDGGYILLEV